MKISELLTDETKWCKMACAKDKDGNLVNELSDTAVKWSLHGAIWKCHSDNNMMKVIIKIHDYMGEKYLWQWNDAPERTFEDVRKLIEELNI